MYFHSYSIFIWKRKHYAEEAASLYDKGEGMEPHFIVCLFILMISKDTRTLISLAHILFAIHGTNFSVACSSIVGRLLHPFFPFLKGLYIALFFFFFCTCTCTFSYCPMEFNFPPLMYHYRAHHTVVLIDH